MLPALSLLLFALVSTAFLAYLGYGLVKLLLPADWRPVEGLLAPLVGYALVLPVGYYAVHTVLNLVGALVAVAALATILNALALWRRRGEGLRLELREHGGAWAIGLLAFLLAVLPLISYGYPTVIGENWDPENYLYVTDALVKLPLNRFYELPPNPLRELNSSLPRIGLTPGFSILQGTLQLFRGWNALNSFAPTVALLYGLAALAFYLLFRQGFRLSRWTSLLATALAGLFPLALWTGLFNFGMQMAALPLVPLALVLWLGLLRNPSWKTMLLAALAVAALPIAYYPALTVFVPAALGLGLVEIIRAPRRLPLFLYGLGTAGLAVLLAVETIFDYQAGFAFRYSQQMTTLGLFTFPPLSQILGLAPFSRTQQALPGLWTAAALVAILVIVLFALLALWRSRERWLWLGALLPGLLYLGWLRGGFWYAANWLQKQGVSLLSADLLERIRPYPYAYLKGAAFVAPVALALAAVGWEKGRDLLDRFSWKRIGRAVLLALVLLPLLLVLLSDRQLIAHYWQRPAQYSQEILQVQQAVDLLPQDASVYLTGSPELSRPAKGLLSYLLRDHPVQGRVSTGYGAMDYRRPGNEPPYALVAIGDDPQLLGFSPENALWSGGGMVLYQRDPAVISFLDLRADAYSAQPTWAIHTTEPLTERQLASFGSCRQVLPGQPVSLYAGINQITDSLLQSTTLTSPEELSVNPRAWELALASLEPTTVTLNWSGRTTETAILPGGLALYTSRTYNLPLPIHLRIDSPGSTPVWLCWAALRQESENPGVVQQTEQPAIWPQASVDGTILQVDLPILNDSGRPLRLALEVWENTFQGAHHYAWWGLLALPRHRAVSLRADLATREAQATIQDKAVDLDPGAASWPEAADGDYFASLWVYYGAQVVEVLPVGRFQLQGGQVRNLQPLENGVRLLWPHSPSQPSGARFGPAIELSAYDRGAGPFSPGDRIPLALEWHALGNAPVDYAVTAQVLRDGKIWGQWDGPAGQWLPATSWQAEQYIRDDIPLSLDPSAPRGHYRLIVAVYDPATGERLPVVSAEGEEGGDALDLGEIVVK